MELLHVTLKMEDKSNSVYIPFNVENKDSIIIFNPKYNMLTLANESFIIITHRY